VDERPADKAPPQGLGLGKVSRSSSSVLMPVFGQIRAQVRLQGRHRL